jgi:hypothetical protein
VIKMTFDKVIKMTFDKVITLMPLSSKWSNGTFDEVIALSMKWSILTFVVLTFDVLRNLI